MCGVDSVTGLDALQCVFDDMVAFGFIHGHRATVHGTVRPERPREFPKRCGVDGGHEIVRRRLLAVHIKPQQVAFDHLLLLLVRNKSVVHRRKSARGYRQG